MHLYLGSMCVSIPWIRIPNLTAHIKNASQKETQPSLPCCFRVNTIFRNTYLRWEFNVHTLSQVRNLARNSNPICYWRAGTAVAPELELVWCLGSGIRYDASTNGSLGQSCHCLPCACLARIARVALAPAGDREKAHSMLRALRQALHRYPILACVIIMWSYGSVQTVSSKQRMV